MDAQQSSIRAAIPVDSFNGVAKCTRATLLSHLQGRHRDLFTQYPLGDYIQLLDTTGQGLSMYASSPRVNALWNTIIAGWGEEALETYHRATMLVLMDTFAERARQHNYPPCIVEQFRINFRRIERNIRQGKPGTYPHTGDNFLKDFSLCRQTAFPGGGAWIIDHRGGYTRSVLLTGGIRQFFSFSYLYLFVLRGNKPFYSMHIHNELARWHTREERQACHLRLVEMLKRHPQVKGLASASWLTDPVIAEISPQLRWVREIPLQNGCKYFRVGEDIDGGALTMSKTRRRLYEEGKYVPTSYLNIWPRKRIIAWARRLARNERGLQKAQYPPIF